MASSHSTGSIESMNNSVLCFDACRLAHRMDALLSWRALFEQSELVRPPQDWRPSAQMSQTGRLWFWGLLPKQKVLACRGETRQYRKFRGQEWQTQLRLTYHHLINFLTHILYDPTKSEIILINDKKTWKTSPKELLIFVKEVPKVHKPKFSKTQNDIGTNSRRRP